MHKLRLYFTKLRGRPRIPTNTSQGYVVAILVVLVVIVIVPYRLVQLKLRACTRIYSSNAKERALYILLPPLPLSQHTPDIHAARQERACDPIGSRNGRKIYEFTSNFFHEDVGEHSTKVVILSPDEPSPRMRALLNHPTFTHRVTYVQGSLDMSVDSERCTI